MASIGVCIPCKDYAEYLPEALLSIRKQDILMRTLIVNDGGDDGEQIDYLCLKYDADVLHLPRTRGIGIARNVGAAYLNTDYVLFLDADDWLHGGSIEALYKILQAHPSAAFAYGNYTQSGDLIDTFPWSEGLQLLHQQNITSYCNLWRREYFWKLGGYASVAVAEDWALQRQVARMGYVGVKTEAIIFEHRIHDNNKWTFDAAKYGGMAGVARLLEGYERQAN